MNDSETYGVLRLVDVEEESIPLTGSCDLPSVPIFVMLLANGLALLECHVGDGLQLVIHQGGIKDAFTLLEDLTQRAGKRVAGWWQWSAVFVLTRRKDKLPLVVTFGLCFGRPPTGI